MIVYERRSVDIIYPDASMICESIFVPKLGCYGLTRGTTRWMKSWLGCCGSSGVINGSSSTWRSVTSGVPQEYWDLSCVISLQRTWWDIPCRHPHQVCRWHWYTWGQGHHSKGTQQAGRMGQEKPFKFNKDKFCTWDGLNICSSWAGNLGVRLLQSACLS